MSDPTFTKTRSNVGANGRSPLLMRSAAYQELSVLLRHPSQIGQGTVPAFGGLSPKSLKEWIAQYESCFGHTAHAKVPAYELEYGEEHSYRQPQQLADITAFYTAFGLHLNSSVHERADHITVECEFMHFLIYKEVYALEHDGEEKALLCRQAARQFLSEHLGRWMPAFSARLAKQAGEGILKSIADKALSFITEDCERLGIKTGPIDLPVRVIQHEQETDCGSCPLS